MSKMWVMTKEFIAKQLQKETGNQNTEQEEVTIAAYVGRKYVLVSCTEEKQFSLDPSELTLEELYILTRNANRVGTEAAKVYKERRIKWQENLSH